MKNIKTLITGGTGLVGSSFPNNENYFKLSSKVDLRDETKTNQLFENLKPQNVIHCAAKVGGVGYNSTSNAEFFIDNLKINLNVLESCKAHNVNKLVSFLSTCMFPHQVEYPLTENKIYMGEPHESNYGYAYSKRILHVQTKLYREQYKANFINVIPTNIYGKYDNFSLKKGHVIPALIHKCYLAKIENKPFEIWGSGKAQREFIYAKDVAELTEWSIDNYNDHKPIIFSNSKEISVMELVDIIIKEIKFKGKVIFDKTKPEGQIRKPTDNSKLKNLLPDFKFTEIEEGISETVNWFLENYNNVRK